jgi:hypothetical protein
MSFLHLHVPLWSSVDPSLAVSFPEQFICYRSARIYVATLHMWCATEKEGSVSVTQDVCKIMTPTGKCCFSTLWYGSPQT